MTFLIGLRSRGAAFLCADGVLSSKLPAKKLEFGPTSTFGEAHILGDVHIEECALKIINLGKIAIGIAGRWALGQSVVAYVSKALADGVEAREAFDSAITAHKPYWTADEMGLDLLAVVPECPAAALLVFRSSTGEIEEVPEDHGNDAGSLNADFTEMTRHLVALAGRGSFSVPELLVCMLAFLQGWGLRNQILANEGVGGAFTGLYATSDRIVWQPDLLYWIGSQYQLRNDTAPDFVATAIRDHVLIARSTFLDRWRFVGNGVNVPSQEKWLERWEETGNRLWETAFEYITLHDTIDESAVIIQMLGKSEHRDVRFRWRKVPPDDHYAVALDMTRPFRDLLLQPRPVMPPESLRMLRFMFREYGPPVIPWPPAPDAASV